MGNKRKKTSQESFIKNKLVKHDNDVGLDIPLKVDKYDSSNEFCLPRHKEKQPARKSSTKPIGRILSKKQRKKLEKVVEKKKRKTNRTELLEALQKVQADDVELRALHSTAEVQTLGFRKFKLTETFKSDEKNIVPAKLRCVSKRGRITNDSKIKSSPNVLGFTSSSEETSEESEPSDIEEPLVVDDVIKSNDEAQDTSLNHSETINCSQIYPSKSIVSKTPRIEMAEDAEKIFEKETKLDQPKSTYVHLDRPTHIQESRLKLPILSEEQVIMEAIGENDVIVLAGETGSGKTTQVPQFLYEAGYALSQKIAVTEPRRVAAISMAARVAEEMGLTAKEVSYQIRFEGNVTPCTKIKFMTDGVLLKEIQKDFLLGDYSAVILDEAHERSVYTDVLIGLLSRIVPLRRKREKPLKLIIMSATLRMEDFTKNDRLFKRTPPVISVESRQFPVSLHFSKKTYDDYAQVAFKKVCKIHETLPDGAILVFLTGQQEVNALCHKLRKKYSNSILRKKYKKGEGKKPRVRASIPDISLDNYPCLPDLDCDEGAASDDDLGDLISDEEPSEEHKTPSQSLFVLPLYSLLPSAKQRQVFEPPPDGSRLCIVATNVAETSLTIPNVRYVVDCGRHKTRVYDKITGVSTFIITWISKASADQRAGRAGRVGPGHCYRLFSSAVFNDEFESFSTPEILRRPVDDLMLQMKAMNISKVVNFPFPSCPDQIQLKVAEDKLLHLGALQWPRGIKDLSHLTIDQYAHKLTELGKSMASFPISPGYAKTLVLSHQYNLFPYSVCLVSALTVPEVLLDYPLETQDPQQCQELRHKWSRLRLSWCHGNDTLLLGDPAVLLHAVGAAEFSENSPSFCNENGLRPRAMQEIRRLRVQLINEVNLIRGNNELYIDPKMKPPTGSQCQLLRQILLAGNIDHVARKVDEEEIKAPEDRPKWKHAYKSCLVEDPVFIHPHSVLRKSRPKFIMYQEIIETGKMYMKGVTAIEPEWLLKFAPTLCNIMNVMENPPPRYDPHTDKIYCHVNATYHKSGLALPLCEMEHEHNIDLYKLFAKFLLEGKVITVLEKYKNVYLSQPDIMLKDWAKLQRRTTTLLASLKSKEVYSKATLISALRSNRTYLLQELLSWLPESTHADFSNCWLSLIKEDSE